MTLKKEERGRVILTALAETRASSKEAEAFVSALTDHEVLQATKSKRAAIDFIRAHYPDREA